MKPLDLLEFFDKGAGDFAFIATYEFDPQFFERRMLGRKTFASADRLVIFMDRGRYQELLRGGLLVAGFNRRYLVIPVDRKAGVFHPKLYLAVGEKRADGIVGSNNCTTGGIAYNMELCSAFTARADHTDHDDLTAQGVIRQIYEAMKVYSLAAPHLREVLETQFFLPVEARVPWLRRDTPLPKSEVELLQSHTTPLWSQLVTRLESQAVRKITVISPFYDQDIDLLKRLRRSWPDAALTIVAQQNYATLAGKKLSKLFAAGKKGRLMAATPKPGRRLHAKAFAFETRQGTFWLTGSPNATMAAFGGLNSEAAVWFKSKEHADALFEDDQITIEEVQPADFEAGTEQEPANEQVAYELRLHSAILSEQGVLECTFDANSAMRDTALRIRNFNETHPALSFPILRSDGKVRIELSESQIAHIRVAAICEVKGTNQQGAEVASNPMALVQLYQLLRERTAHSGGRNPLQAIAETGENLVPYIDSLGSVREAVEFFDHCSIRFQDGEISPHRQGQPRWKPRDPFQPDTPVNWLNVPSGSSAADLREAIWNFVERHQWEKLYKHVRRGNLNGLPNFLDIFRTLNGLLLTYHTRDIDQTGPVIPFPFVTKGIMDNLELLIGPFEAREDAFEGNGFVSAILANVAGDKKIVRERLHEERVPQMIGAAVEAMVQVRMRARKLAFLDPWSTNRLRWVTDWIKQRGLDVPTATDVSAATIEYMPAQIAA
jgi:HKD family nuclease